LPILKPCSPSGKAHPIITSSISSLLIFVFEIRFLSYSIPNMLGNKIGGFNGDACGASIVLVESVMLFMYAILL